MTPEEMEKVLRESEARAEDRFRRRAWTTVALVVGLGIAGYCGWTVYRANREAEDAEREAREGSKRSLEEIRTRAAERQAERSDR